MIKKLSLFLLIILTITLLAACTSEEAVNEQNDDPEAAPIEEIEEQEEQGETEEQEETEEYNKEQEEPFDTLYLSVYMTKEEVVESVGENFSLITEEEYGGVSYYSELEYEGIVFYYTHKEEELPDDAIADLIEITSNKYSYNFDLEIDGNFLEAIEYCEQNFENTFDANSDKEIFNMFNYIEIGIDGKEEKTDYVLRLDYNAEEYYESKEDIPKDLKLDKVSLFVPLD